MHMLFEYVRTVPNVALVLRHSVPHALADHAELVEAGTDRSEPVPRLKRQAAVGGGLSFMASCAETAPPVCRWRQVSQASALGRTHRSAWKLSSAA